MKEVETQSASVVCPRLHRGGAGLLTWTADRVPGIPPALGFELEKAQPQIHTGAPIVCTPDSVAE